MYNSRNWENTTPVPIHTGGLIALKSHTMRCTALTLAVLLLTGSASALFGKKQEESAPEEGKPVAQDIEIRTYRRIPVQ